MDTSVKPVSLSESLESVAARFIKENKKVKESENKTSGPLNQALTDFAEHRRKLKKPMTDRAKKLLLADLDKLAETDREKILIIEQSILQGWSGVFALRQQGKQTTFENLDAGRL